jgi:hypothetical protein
VGAEGFRLLYFHAEFGGMKYLLCFTVLQTWFWNDFVGSVSEVKCYSYNEIIRKKITQYSTVPNM